MEILVENLGRLNFGFNLDNDRKGITKLVQINETFSVIKWEHYLLPLDFDKFREMNESEARLRKFEENLKNKEKEFPGRLGGIFYAELDINSKKEIGDTYIDMSKWGKGLIWVNGYNLGRYWRVGP